MQRYIFLSHLIGVMLLCAGCQGPPQTVKECNEWKDREVARVAARLESAARGFDRDSHDAIFLRKAAKCYAKEDEAGVASIARACSPSVRDQLVAAGDRISDIEAKYDTYMDRVKAKP